MTDPAQLHPVSRTTARRRISAIWLIPLVAVVIGSWLAWDTLSKEGPTIKVSFRTAEGLEPGKSLLKFKDIVFGTVKDLQLSPDNNRVVVTIATTRQAEPLLNSRTVFWVVKPRLFAGNVSGLSTLLSGAYVALEPGPTPAKPQREFTGQEDPPVLEAHVPGRIVLLTAPRIGSISVGSPLFFRDLNVGEVLGWDIADLADSVTIRVFVRAPYDAYVNAETRFWNASGLSVSFGGAGIKVQVESMRALLLGGVAFETPPSETGEAKIENNLFPLFPDRETANAASYTREIKLVSYFPSSVGGLAPGSDVTMRGLKIGRVTDVRLTYDREKDAVVAPVHYEVQPERIVGVGTRVLKTDADAVEALLKKGLRASVQSANLITGQQVVALEFIPDATVEAVTMEGDDFVLPTTESGGFASLAASATDVLNKVNTIPFDDIGRNLAGILKEVNGTVRDPKIQKALTDLSVTLTSVREVTGNLDKGSAPALKRLPEIAATLQISLTNANKLVESLDRGYGDNTQFNRDLDRLLVQLGDATRSIRALADLLARNPEALIKGRPKGSFE